ncbi:hypothetical protein RA264_28165, partial [Pseudomonas syringae pv. tagetis]|uniref:hypothetical protein n=1 Tax=Pseudomonas syringae group genomosp. 7 TaxID=251699 RepID=UPI00376FE431
FLFVFVLFLFFLLFVWGVWFLWLCLGFGCFGGWGWVVLYFLFVCVGVVEFLFVWNVWFL